MPDTVDIGSYLNIFARTPSAPAIIRGSADLSTAPGVTTGVLRGRTERTANGAALQAGLDWAATNGKWVEIPPGRYEFIAAGVQGGRNVGLRIPRGASVIGGGSDVNTGARLIQYATNHPAITLGSIVTDEFTEGALIRGLVVGHGVSQAGQPTAEGILIGEYWRSSFDDLLVNPLFAGVNPPTYGVRIGAGNSSTCHFFSNNIGTIVCWGAQVSLWLQRAGSTGNRFENVYLGSGTFGNRGTTSSHAFLLDAPGSDIGSFGQLNVEWTAPADNYAPLAFNGCDGVDVAHLHLEGNRAGGRNAPIIASVAVSKFNISTIKVLDAWVATANVSGTPALFSCYGDCQIDVGQIYLKWMGSGYNPEAVATAPVQLFYASDTATLGVRRDVEVRNIDVAGNTGAFHFDASLTGAAPGSAGAIYGARRYTYNAGRSRTEGAAIEMRDSNMTIFAAHEKALVRATAPLTADRKLVLSNNLSSSGVGKVPCRRAGDEIFVHRTAAATGAFKLNIRDNADATTVVALSAANTEAVAVLGGTGTWDVA